MYQAPKPSNGITLDYATPAAEVALVRQLVAEHELLVSFDLETAQISRIVPPSTPPVEFGPERSGVVDTSYCLTLDPSRRKRRAS